MISKGVESRTQCVHCGDPCPSKQFSSGTAVFCCAGCKAVYEILQSNDLCEYYALNEHPGSSQQFSGYSRKFAFLDLPEVQARLIQFRDARRTHVTFYVPRMHCSSCLWLLENLHRLNENILDSRVDFSKKEVFVIFETGAITLRQVAELLHRIGYEPHIAADEQSQSVKRNPDRKRWYKIGIAGFCFGNIMMLSLPEYFAGAQGLDPSLKTLFTTLIVLLSLPVITYAASEFFTAAWQGLRRRYINIDAPIALALLITFGRSLYEITSGTGPGYLDSMSGIVFFMLIGRWLQDKTHRTISFDRDYRSFFPIAATVIRHGKKIITPIEQLAENDCLEIHHGELIPADALLLTGKASIDYSFVTGESMPVTVHANEIIYAGGRQAGGRLEVMVVKPVSQSYLTRLWNQGHHAKAPDGHSFIDTLSRYFTYIVLAIGIAAAGYWHMQGEPQLMWNALTTILIVACPCALLLSANFTYGNMLRILSREKLYLRHAMVLEKLAAIDTIILDKTGTITQKDGWTIRYEGLPMGQELKQNIAAVLANATHPLSLAVYHALDCTRHPQTSDFRLVANQGIEGWINDCHIKIGSPSFIGLQQENADGSAVCIAVDGKYTGTFYITHHYRPYVFDTMRRLSRQFRLAIASGDNNASEATLRRELGNDVQLLFNQKPEDKYNLVKEYRSQHHHVLMAGDGLNDAAALQASDVGLAITEDDSHFTPAADGILHATRVATLDRILTYAKAGRHIIHLSFGLSILYNVIGLYFAVQGTLSPVIAAILMPISSVSIILLTYSMSGWIWQMINPSNADKSKIYES